MDTEFEVENGYEYLANPVEGSMLRIRYNDRELYVKTAKRENFTRKLALKEKYKANTAVNTQEAIGSETVLGYPTPHKQYKDAFYDCSTFFLNNAFMAETKSRQALVYVIPEHEIVYEESDYGPQEQSFEAGTTIDYTEAGEKEGDTILQVSITSVELPRWIGQKELTNKATVNSNTLSLTGAVTLTLFTQNPLEYQFREKERTGILADTLVLLQEQAVVKTAALVEYCQYSFGGQSFYIKKTDRDSYAENILEWEKHFIVYDPQSDNLVYNPTDEAGKEIDAVIRKERPPAGREWSRDELTVFKRMLFCKHPLEWDKTKYDSALIRNRLCSGDEGLHEILREKADKLDIWGSIKDHETIRQPANNLWFAHPVYFINHMNKAGLLDKTFNPYYGKPIDLGGKTVIDNPGFAPYIPETGQYDGYCAPTGLFLQDYTRIYEKPYNHEGVDFGAGKGTLIHSFIDATVIATGYRAKDYGNYIVLQSIRNEKHFFLLGHLDRVAENIGKDVSVSPKDIVGYVGLTGNVRGAHLHVSLIVAEAVNDVCNVTTSELRNGLIDRMINPFNYENLYQWRKQ